MPTTFTWEYAEYAVLLVGTLLGVAATLIAARWCAPRPLRGGAPLDQNGTKFIELEQGRALSAAKGLASGSSGFLLALLTALFKDEIAATVSAYALAGCVCGAVGLLLVSAHLSREAGLVTLALRDGAPRP